KVILNNGGVLEGIILKETEEEVVVMSRVGELTLSRSTIAEIQRGNSYQVYLDRAESFIRQKKFLSARENLTLAERVGCPKDLLKKHQTLLEHASRNETERQMNEQLATADALRAKGRLQDAIDTLNRLPTEQKNDPRVRRALTQMLCGSAYEHIDHFRFNQAVRNMIQARDLGAPKAELHFLMGLLKQSEGRMALAQYEFGEALQADPDVYNRFPGSIKSPLFPVPIEARAEVAMISAASLDLNISELDIGLDRQIALKTHPLDQKTTKTELLIPPGTSADKEEILRHIHHFADIYGVDPCLVEAVAKVESALNPKAVSPAGAKGVMQLMPLTAKDMGVKDIFDPKQNIEAGAKYLGLMMRKFQNTELALAAYNAGPSTVEFYGKIPPYPETKRFVPLVIKERDRIRSSRDQLVQSK
ncbi:MAG TPA: lytic transglycosylase domain-containing protein, partial [bacterium]|nr:lytic transglycosylase domain-containing protein [bacterium]